MKTAKLCIYLFIYLNFELVTMNSTQYTNVNITVQF